MHTPVRSARPLHRFLLKGLGLLLLGATLPAFATQVPETVSKTAAHRFLTSTVPSYAGLAMEDLDLVRTEAAVAFGQTGATYYRAYNVTGNGFVVIAGDDAAYPVLAYSTESTFTDGELPINVAKWFEGYKVQLRDAVDQSLEANTDVRRAWDRLLEGLPEEEREFRAVEPLVQTRWDQTPHVNALCPGGSVTGCVATAMAQIMKYHNHPEQGAGFHSYNAPNYGTLSANFGATTYNWSAMPNVVSSANTAVATLMYHCGVSVDMQYSPQVSGAWVIQANSPTTDHNSEYAMKTYFGYDPSMQGVKRENYTDAQWITLLKGELDASRPILYAGWGSGGGHAFVCDGYDNNNFFHFNWGWGGQQDGYFTINALNPGSTGTGGGTGGYNSGHQILKGIRPATGGGGGGGGSTTFDMGLYNFVSPSASTIFYGAPFSVTTNIVNNGTNSFSGDYCAAAFDADNNFYGYVQTLTGYTLAPGNAYNNNLVFSSAGLLSMLPGTYYIGVFYRPTGGEWVALANNGGYANFPQVTVINPNAIELNSAMQVSPGTTLTQGGQVSVNLNIVNDGFDTFFGQYGVGLFNLDGSWAQDIGVLNENNGLPYGYSYLAPYLTFGPVAVTVPPGTYLLAAQHNVENTGWQLTGSSYFSNPVFVTVVAPGVSPDQYEANNAPAQAATLPVNFSGNNASTSTTGSNLHNPTDQDFYKIVLPAGNNYAITARLHDSYNSGNGNTYSVDGMFSFSGDGNNWSEVFDDVMPGNIVVNGGGTVYFHVAPYFTGETGTYLLQLDIVRGATVGVDEAEALAGIRVFPNPANDRLTIDLADFTGRLNGAELFDMQGQRVLAPNVTGVSGRVVLDLGALATGAYVLHLSSDQGIRTERIIVAR